MKNVHSMKGYGKDVNYASLVEHSKLYAGERGYCSVIALAIAMGCYFGKARRIMRTEGNRPTGRGASTRGIERAFASCGKRLEHLPMGRGFMIANSAKRLPRHGTFIIYSSSHVTCLKDGIVEDWCVLPHASGKRMQAVYQVLDA